MALAWLPIVVPAGAISVTFSVTTRLVAADTSATISALLGADKSQQ